MNVSLREVAFKHRAIREDLDAFPLRFVNLSIHLTSVDSTTPALVESLLHRLLLLSRLLIFLLGSSLLEEIEGTELFVDLSNFLVWQGLSHIFVVLQGEVMISLCEKRVQPLPNINLDLIHCQLHVLNLHLVFGHIDLEGLEVLFDGTDALLQVVLLVVEFNIVELPDVFHE
jgi:hypothetical protein